MKNILSVIRLKWMISLIVLFGVGTVFAAPPQITDLSASQRAGTKLVDITYTLACDTPACEVSVRVSSTGGAPYDLLASSFSGNGYGSGVTNGIGKQIVWDAGMDWRARYSSQVWFEVTAFESSTNPLTFTLNTNIFVDTNNHSLWAQPVYDGTCIVAVTETSDDITAKKYDLNLNTVSPFSTIATTNDTGGDLIADHKNMFQNNYHYLVFSIQGDDSDGGSLWLIKVDRDLNRTDIIQVVTNEPPTNDMLIFGDGESVYVGKFYPEGRAAHKIYKYDSNLNFITNYVEGLGTNSHANADTAMYLDERFYFVSPQYVGPGANDKYYRVVYDTNFNVIKSKSIILQDTNKVGVVNGLSYYNGRFIVHYCRGSNDANPIGRAVFDANDWSLIQNETVITGGNHASHSIVLSNTLYLGYTEQSASFNSHLAKYTISESNPSAMEATDIGYVGPITVNTLSASLVSADYDGDGLADPAIYDEVTGIWKVKLSSANYYQITTTLNGLGGDGYASISADYDGDGKADPAVYQEANGTWIILLSSLGHAIPIVIAQPLGGSGYSGMPGDYDGDQLADPGVYKRMTGDWRVMLSSANYYTVEVLGLLGGAGYRAVAADYDGDHKADPAIYGESSGYWIFKLSSMGYAVELVLTQTLGGTGYIPVPADYDGDGKADLAVRSQTSNEWIVMFSSGGYTPVPLTILFE